MANYYNQGGGASLFAMAAGRGLGHDALYETAAEFGVANADGSKTYFHGEGFVWNGSGGHVVAGAIHGIFHYSPEGAFVDCIKNLSVSASDLDALLRHKSTTAREIAALLMDGRDHLAGDHRDDVLEGHSGADEIIGGAGNDRLVGGSGPDDLIGGGGDDRLTGGGGADQLDGGDGIDWALYRASPSGVHIDLAAHIAEWGDAEGDGLSGIENLVGSSHADTLVGDGNDNQFAGNAGEDTLHGNAGNDRLSGGRSNDFLTGSEGDDRILGGAGDDMIDGGIGQDIIMGGSGNDTIYGGPDPDVILYTFAWEQMTVTYDGSDYSIWVETPDGYRDHVFSALTFATTTGTYHFDVPSQTWVLQSAMTTDDWLAR